MSFNIASHLSPPSIPDLVNPFTHFSFVCTFIHSFTHSTNTYYTDLQHTHLLLHLYTQGFTTHTAISSITVYHFHYSCSNLQCNNFHFDGQKFCSILLSSCKLSQKFKDWPVIFVIISEMFVYLDKHFHKVIKVKSHVPLPMGQIALLTCHHQPHGGLSLGVRNMGVATFSAGLHPSPSRLLAA